MHPRTEAGSTCVAEMRQPRRGWVTVAHPGTQHSLQAAAALAKDGLLDRFITRLYFDRARAPFSWLPDSALSFLDRILWKRHHAGIPCDRVRMAGWAEEVGLVLLHRMGTPHRALTPLVTASQARFARLVRRRLSPDCRALVCYSTAALEAFEQARARGIACVLDLAQIHPRASLDLFREEARLSPEFTGSIPFAYRSKKALERYEREVALADHLIVASEFARRSMIQFGASPGRVSVAPYGVDARQFEPAGEPRPSGGRFRILFVGSIGQLKGIKYLLDAFAGWAPADAELALCGNMLLSADLQARYAGLYRHERYRPHQDLSALYRSADVVVFPSLADGFGLVVLEAMASGVPVIASANCCAPDVIADGYDGFVAPIRDAGVLRDRMETIYRDRSLAREMGRRARRKALAYSWENYGRTLRSAIEGVAGRQGRPL